uniref:RNA polymerase Rpb7-like N-terminal domain-containing protein n=1 Tax=Rhinella marina erythrocytic-like virus TaxID=2859906 RepID=A0A8F6UA95_9VIRU|nr:hypothetical protein RMELV040 [Rhinella marina erythrocytic-like virus]
MSVPMDPITIYNPEDLTHEKYTTWVSVKPSQLCQPSLNLVTDILGNKILRNVDAKYGFILALNNIKILDNKIGEHGHVEYLTSMFITSILPRTGLVFKSKITTVLPEGCITNNPHFQNLLIGGKQTNLGYKMECGCLLNVNSITLAKIEATVFQRGKYTCICRHLCSQKI